MICRLASSNDTKRQLSEESLKDDLNISINETEKILYKSCYPTGFLSSSEGFYLFEVKLSFDILVYYSLGDSCWYNANGMLFCCSKEESSCSSSSRENISTNFKNKKSSVIANCIF